MLFGSSFTEALNAGFGVIGKQQEREDKLAATLAKENREISKALAIHRGKEAIDKEMEGPGGIEFGKKATEVNIGTNVRPIMASKVVTPTGQIAYVSAGVNGGKPFGVSMLKELSKANPGIISSIHSPWYSKGQRNTESRKNKKDLQGIIKSRMDQFLRDKATDEQKETYNSSLISMSEVTKAFEVFKDAGIDTGYGYDNSIEDIMYTAVIKQLRSGSKASLDVLVRNEIIYADFAMASLSPSHSKIPDSAYQTRSYDPTTGSYTGKNLVEPAETPDDAWIRTKKGVTQYFKKLAGNDEASKTSFNRQVAQTHVMFQQWEKENGLVKDKNTKEETRTGAALSNFKNALEKGYTPFSWWVKKDHNVKK